VVLPFFRISTTASCSFSCATSRGSLPSSFLTSVLASLQDTCRQLFQSNLPQFTLITHATNTQDPQQHWCNQVQNTNMCHVKLVLDTVLMQRSCSKAPSMMIAAPFRPTYHNAMAMIIAAAYMQLHTCQAAAGCPLPGRSLLHSAEVCCHCHPWHQHWLQP